LHFRPRHPPPIRPRGKSPPRAPTRARFGRLCHSCHTRKVSTSITLSAWRWKPCHRWP
jgi:hypothetical protein